MKTSQTKTSCSIEGLNKETLDLVTELQFSDIQNILNAKGGEQHEADTPDLKFAVDVYRQDLESLRSQSFDLRMAQSMASAVQLDGNLIFQIEREEEVMNGDRVLAHQLNGNKVTNATVLSPKCLDRELLAKLAGMYMSESIGDEIYAAPDTFEDHSSSDAESSAWAAKRQRSEPKNPDMHCEACQNSKKYFDIIAAPCQHNYCRDCLRDLFRASLTDESLFPPRCCHLPIPVNSVDIFLTEELKKAFAEKEIEYGTPDRTYCSDPQCSAFIPSCYIEADVGTCTGCGTSTCVTCKSTAHGGDCPADNSLQGLLHLAEENGWQRCHSCRRMVELDHGCNHMTCRCGAQFCYICGERWKSCRCLQWNEDRLLARANVIVQREAPRLAVDHSLRIQQVQQTAQMLRDRHDCTHTCWAYISGPHQCEECYHHLPQYIFQCQQCRIHACNRCRRNRL